MVTNDVTIVKRGRGRPSGSKSRRTREIAEKLAQGGITPLEYMISVMANSRLEHGMRLDAAKSAAPYMHPRLNAITVSGDPDGAAIEQVTRIELVAPFMESTRDDGDGED